MFATQINLNMQSLVVMFSVCLFPSMVIAADETSDGQLIFNNNCRTCHSRDAGDNRLGPTLHNIVGRKAGSVDGYSFSASMEGSNITWTKETLDKFIANPEAVVPGNSMRPYGGLESAKERATLVDFLAGE